MKLLPKPTLPNQAHFLVQYALFFAVLFYSSPLVGVDPYTRVIVLSLIGLFFLAVGWLIFKLVHRVEWQYLQGFGNKGYAYLKLIRWILVWFFFLVTVIGHWLDPSLSPEPIWVDAVIAYGSVWMTAWLAPLLVLWPVAYYKKPTEQGDYEWRNITLFHSEESSPNFSAKQSTPLNREGDRASFADLTILRTVYLKPVFWLFIWLFLLVSLYQALSSFLAFVMVLIFLALIVNPFVQMFAGLLVLISTMLEVSLRAVLSRPKFLTKKEKSELEKFVTEKEVDTEILVTESKQAKNSSNNFWLGIIAGAVGISLISGCDNETE